MAKPMPNAAEMDRFIAFLPQKVTRPVARMFQFEMTRNHLLGYQDN